MIRKAALQYELSFDSRVVNKVACQWLATSGSLAGQRHWLNGVTLLLGKTQK